MPTPNNLIITPNKKKKSTLNFSDIKRADYEKKNKEEEEKKRKAKLVAGTADPFFITQNGNAAPQKTTANTVPTLDDFIPNTKKTATTAPKTSGGVDKTGTLDDYIPNTKKTTTGTKKSGSVPMVQDNRPKMLDTKDVNYIYDISKHQGAATLDALKASKRAPLLMEKYGKSIDAIYDDYLRATGKYDAAHPVKFNDIKRAEYSVKNAEKNNAVNFSDIKRAEYAPANEYNAKLPKYDEKYEDDFKKFYEYRYEKADNFDFNEQTGNQEPHWWKVREEIAKKNGWTLDEFDEKYGAYENYLHTKQNLDAAIGSEQFAREHPILGTIFSFALAPQTMVEGAGTAVETLLGEDNVKALRSNEGNYANYNTYSKEYGLPGVQQKEGMRTGAKSTIDSGVGNFLYDIGTNVGDMAVDYAFGLGTPVGMGFATGSKTAAQNYQDALERGVDPTRAGWYGTATGAIGGILGGVGLDVALEAPADSVIGAAFKAALSEGLEEVVEENADKIADMVINQDKSEMVLNYQRYRQQGMSDNDAWAQVAKDIGVDLVQAGITGAIFGGVIRGAAQFAASRAATPEVPQVDNDAMASFFGTEPRTGNVVPSVDSDIQSAIDQANKAAETINLLSSQIPPVDADVAPTEVPMVNNNVAPEVPATEVSTSAPANVDFKSSIHNADGQLLDTVRVPEYTANSNVYFNGSDSDIELAEAQDKAIIDTFRDIITDPDFNALSFKNGKQDVYVSPSTTGSGYRVSYTVDGVPTGHHDYSFEEIDDLSQNLREMAGNGGEDIKIQRKSDIATPKPHEAPVNQVPEAVNQEATNNTGIESNPTVTTEAPKTEAPRENPYQLHGEELENAKKTYKKNRETIKALKNEVDVLKKSEKSYRGGKMLKDVQKRVNARMKEIRALEAENKKLYRGIHGQSVPIKEQLSKSEYNDIYNYKTQGSIEQYINYTVNYAGKTKEAEQIGKDLKKLVDNFVKTGDLELLQQIWDKAVELESLARATNATYYNSGYRHIEDLFGEEENTLADLVINNPGLKKAYALNEAQKAVDAGINSTPVETEVAGESAPIETAAEETAPVETDEDVLNEDIVPEVETRVARDYAPEEQAKLDEYLARRDELKAKVDDATKHLLTTDPRELQSIFDELNEVNAAMQKEFPEFFENGKFKGVPEVRAQEADVPKPVPKVETPELEAPKTEVPKAEEPKSNTRSQTLQENLDDVDRRINNLQSTRSRLQEEFDATNDPRIKEGLVKIDRTLGDLNARRQEILAGMERVNGANTEVPAVVNAPEPTVNPEPTIPDVKAETNVPETKPVESEQKAAEQKPTRPSNEPLVLTQDENGDVVESGTSKHLRSTTDVRVATPMKYDVPDEVSMEFVNDPTMYKQLKNADTKALAEAIYDSGDTPVTINGKTYDGNAEAKFRQLLAEKNPASLPLGARIAKDYSAKGNHKAAAQIYRDMGAAHTEAGRFNQAAIISMMKSDPLTALAYFEKQIEDMNAEGREKYRKKWKDFVLTDEERAMFNDIEDGDTAAIKDAYDTIGARIEKEYPVSMWEKVLEFRRVALLFNSKTIGKNFSANPPTALMRYISDRIEGVGQYVAHLINPEFEITQSIRGSNLETRKLATKIYKSDKVQQLLKQTPGRLSEVPKVGDYAKSKQIFKGWIVSDFINKMTNNGIEKLNAKLGKKGAKSALELARNSTYAALEVTDSPFVRENFVSRLGSYMRAKGITDVADVPDAAIKIALEESLMATYKDNSWLVKGLRKFKGGIEDIGNGIFPGVRLGDMASQALIPYVQAPGNIGARIVDYSAVGGTKGVIDIIRGASKGDMNIVSKGINEFSKGATGTMLAALGMALYKAGIVTGTESTDPDQRAFQKQNGFREFSFRYKSPIDGQTKYDTFNWAQPSADSIMTGVLLAQAIETADAYDSDILRYFGYEGTGAGRFIGATRAAVGKEVNYYFNATPLKNLGELLQGGFNGDTDIAENIRENMIEDFITGLNPAGVNAIAKSVDPIQRVTYDPSNTFTSFVNTNKARIPAVSTTLPVKYDTWGEPMTYGDSRGEAAFAKMFYPGEHTSESNDSINKEINKLFDETGNNGVFPHVSPNSIDGVKLTAEEKSRHQEIMGKQSRALAESFIRTNEYAKLDSKTKANALQGMFDFSKKVADYEIKGKELSESDQKLYDLYKKGYKKDIVDYYIERAAKGDAAAVTGLETNSTAVKEIAKEVKAGNDEKAAEMTDDATQLADMNLGKGDQVSIYWGLKGKVPSVKSTKDYEKFYRTLDGADGSSANNQISQKEFIAYLDKYGAGMSKEEVDAYCQVLAEVLDWKRDDGAYRKARNTGNGWELYF